MKDHAKHYRNIGKSVMGAAWDIYTLLKAGQITEAQAKAMCEELGIKWVEDSNG